MSASALFMAAAMASALAATPAAADDPDGVVATAPRTPIDLDPAYTPVAPTVTGAAQQAAPHGLTTDQQIDRWLDARNPDVRPFENDDGEAAPERRMRTEITAGIGTGGFRQYGAAVTLPLGDHGSLGFSYNEVKNGYPMWGYGPGEPAPWWFEDSGYVFPGGRDRVRAWEQERRLRRPGGPPTIGGMLSTPTAEE
ncbi:hypothetical protein GCM10009422_14610 [Brevundimonas kwangchunensis]|uniref:Uncharacterized protein n=1 Tax=Brevundimonas kwangchunensis TaxID=322163 RepID=A0ABN1GUK7_9CAUL